jgi:DNA mismatch repair ATPase MutS
MLANTRTRSATGFEKILSDIEVRTVYGAQKKKELKPFFPGQEPELAQTYDCTDVLCDAALKKPEVIQQVIDGLWHIKEIRQTLKKSAEQTLSVVELFDLKSFLLRTSEIRKALREIHARMPGRYELRDTDALLNRLDPSGERIDTFYIYDAFSPVLSEFRREKKQLEVEIRKAQKSIASELLAQHGIRMTPKFELLVPKADTSLLALVSELDALEKSDEDYMTIVYTLAKTPELDAFHLQQETLEERIEQEEDAVCRMLTQEVVLRVQDLYENCEAIGFLDFDLGKALYATSKNCVRPDITPDIGLCATGGRNLVVEEVLGAQGKPYCPVDVDLSVGVTAITGANMGGKTISLKMIGQIALLAQYGLYVPCEFASLGLSNYIHLLVGDGQNVQRGLSSFGSEMEELREILDRAQERSLILIDEIASGTNPTEGLALTRSFIRYFSQKPYITVITTHFDHATVGEHIVNLQVRGLASADFDRLHRELSYANRRERIEIIAKYTDYRLMRVDRIDQVPREALNIASMLGIYPEIIDEARRCLTEC